MTTKEKKGKNLQIQRLENRLMLDASVTGTANLVLWFDAADASTILDADGDNADTGMGGNNDGFSGEVATWLDKSGSVGSDVTANAGERPLYGVNTQNGNGVITFDGINDRLTDSFTISGDDVTMFVVYNRTNDTGRDAVFELGSGGSRNGIFLYANDTVQHYSNGTFRANAGTYALGDYHLSTFVHDSNTIQGWMNGTSTLNTTTSTRNTTGSITIGDDVTSGDEMTGTVAEVIVFDRDLTNDERHDVENYLAGKWGLSITNAAPVNVINTDTNLNEGNTITITDANLTYTDADNTNSRLIYTVTGTPSHGVLQLSGVTLNNSDTFTQDDLNNNLITYIHDGSENFTDTLNFTLSDRLAVLAGQNLDIVINPVNDIPVLNNNNALLMNEGDSISVLSADLEYLDDDNTPLERVYSASNITNGHIEVNGTVQTSFTQRNIDLGEVDFIHDGSETASAGFDFQLTDGTFTTVLQNFVINVNSINDTPSDILIDNTSILENSTPLTDIGILSTIDGDIGDTFTYTLVSNPGNTFQIVGDRLIAKISLNYETQSQYILSVQTDDGNGGIFTRQIIVFVQDIFDPQNEIGNDGFIQADTGQSDFSSANTETQSIAGQNVIRDSGNISTSEQIIRTNVSEMVRDIQNGPSLESINVEIDTSAVLNPASGLPEDVSDSPEADIQPSGEQYTNIRESIEFLSKIHNSEQTDNISLKELNASDLDSKYMADQSSNNFEDVLRYHETRQAKLREALSS